MHAPREASRSCRRRLLPKQLECDSVCVWPPTKRPPQHPHHHHPHHHPRGTREPAAHAHTHVSAQPYRKHVVPRNRGTQAHDRQGTVEMREKATPPRTASLPTRLGHACGVVCGPVRAQGTHQAGRPQHAMYSRCVCGNSSKNHTDRACILCMHPVGCGHPTSPSQAVAEP